jgi:hypothetical protein
VHDEAPFAVVVLLMAYGWCTGRHISQNCQALKLRNVACTAAIT